MNLGASYWSSGALKCCSGRGAFSVPWSPRCMTWVVVPTLFKPYGILFPTSQDPSRCMRYFQAWLVAEDTSGGFGSFLKEGCHLGTCMCVSSLGSQQSSRWALEAWLKLAVVTRFQRPLWPRALPEYGALWPKKSLKSEPLLLKVKNRQGVSKDTTGYNKLGWMHPKMGLLDRTFSHNCANFLWDVLVLWMEKGHLFLGPSARDVLWAQDLSNRVTRPISLNICLYLDQTGKGKSVSQKIGMF